MIRICLSLLLLLPLYVCSQISDDFSDGDFLLNPTWSGDTGQFEVDTAFRLQLMDTSAGSSFLAVPSKSIINASWQFLVRMNFNPSSGNLARVYLTSDEEMLNGDLNGYYIELGGSNDEVSLFRQDGTTRTKIIDGKNDRLDLPEILIRVMVERDDNGKWDLWIDSTGGFSYVPEGSTVDDQFLSYNHFGIFCKYTVTRSDQFFFDEFEVTGLPFIDTATTQIDRHDLIINEVMFIPEPVFGLPPVEYVELFNNSDKAINLSDCRFSDATSTKELEAYIFLPQTYLILCSKNDQSLFESYGNVLGLTSFPTLNNDGDELMIQNKSGSVIHYVPYSADWFRDDVRDNGGFSIEMIDPNNPCEGASNWKASKNDRGGSPGRQNSISAINPDISHPKLLRIAYVDSVTIDLIFNEALDSQSTALDGAFITQPDLGLPQKITIMPPDFRKLRIEFSREIEEQVVYELTASDVVDCSGNPVMINNSGRFGRPEPIAYQDMIINEVLFNPLSGGNDFVELYNRSDKIIDLEDILLFEASFDEPDSLLEESWLSDGNYLSFPGDHLVVTKDRSNLSGFYPIKNQEWLLEVNDLPNYPDDAGIVRLFSREAGTIDELQYTRNWHFPLLINKNGVSLERVNPYGVTQDPNNWHSAASTVGYATPTYSNSQLSNATEGNGEITIEPKVFSPDQDGFNDYVNISYRFDLKGYLGNVQIFNMKGIRIRHLIKNLLLGVEGTFSWDGINESGENAEIGIYLIYFEAFTPNGEIKKFIENIVIGGKF